MGSLFSGSQKTKTSSTTDTGPSKFQQPYLSNAFDDAQSLYNSKSNTPWYQGQLYAGMSDQAKQALTDESNYATQTGLGTANQLTSMGTGLAGNFDKASGALSQYLTMAGQDPTEANIASAGKYADNPYLSAQIDAANRDVTRQLNEQTLPTIDRTASGTGNLNSSRAGVAQGIAMRGAADQEADTAATMRGQAYSQGLTLAQQDRAQNLNALGTAVNDYANLGTAGVNALNAGTQAGYGAYSTINSANSAEQQDRQGQDDAAYQAWLGNDQRQQQLLQNYYNIIGANQWGQYGTSTGTSKTTSTPSLLQSGLGIASAVAGFMP